ncbi:hypothetical protein [Methylomagnum ishizawai]|uniref:hypothetical protein n=1 Tax=Methylomagnum ishizawai TaxID=1760988 RepID=UPI001C33724C|nr:hypothetical protein [Methylomagnum ishizawai]BBL74454.1 hypothetical protein MishRS11D_15520 [Methylomagnum ishizawai]
MPIIHQIQGRDALLVWAIPFASGREIPPDSLAGYLRDRGDTGVLPPQSDFPSAFQWHNRIRGELYPSQWEELCGNLERLRRDLGSRSLPEVEDRQEWVIASAKLFPARVYVWLDEFNEWLGKASPFKLK